MQIFFNVMFSDRLLVSQIVWIWEPSGLSICSKSANDDDTRRYVNELLPIASGIYGGPLYGPNHS